MKISGRLVDIHNREMYDSVITFENGVIKNIERTQVKSSCYILPALIDAHIHIESSMIAPSAFAVEAVKHGTIAVVSDPHEIANVCGVGGINFMIANSKGVPVRFYFGAPSCVPATHFETSGGIIDKFQVEKLLRHEDIFYLSEMMNFPGVIHNDPDVHYKLEAAKREGKKIDGHAPGVSGEDLVKYVKAGIETDHECSTYNEAVEKISLGMKILIREGSAAKNLDSLKELVKTYPDKVMLCSDDLHPEMLLKGHINKLVAKLLREGYNVYDVLRSATINPVVHYGIKAGLLRVGDPADFIVVQALENMDILQTWIDGTRVYDNGKVYFNARQNELINNFNSKTITEESIVVQNKGKRLRVIQAFEGELLTRELITTTGNGSVVVPDLEKDYLKIIVKDRYNDSPPAVGFIKGFDLKKGAFASSVAHDSHNIICVGTNDNDIVQAVNEVIKMKGGLVTYCDNEATSLRLDIGGIMSTESCETTALYYNRLNSIVKEMGCTMTSPFMTLAFMALLVIPDLKIGDKGLFDVRTFNQVPLFLQDLK